MKRLKEWLESSIVGVVFLVGMMRRTERFNGRVLRLWQIPMMLFWMLGGFLLRPVLSSRRRWMRPVRHWLMMKFIRQERENAKKGIVKNPNTVSLVVWWEFLERSSWDDVVPLIWKQATLYPQIKACVGFAEMYLLNARFEEAQAAASLAVHMADEWVQQNPEKAREALRVRKAEPSWRFKSKPLPQNADMNDVHEEIERGWSLGMALAEVDGGLMTQWRNAHLAVALVEEVMTRREEGRLEWPLPSPPQEQPVGIAEAPFNLRFAQRIGMTEKQFDGLLRRVTKLNI